MGNSTLDKPKISVIVPCFNRANFLNETLASVQNQTFGDWECIIVNSGTDATSKIAGDWVSKDSRFKYFEKENEGPSAARNLGVSKSSAAYIFPLDDDDHIDPTYFEKAVAILDQNPDVKVVHTRVLQFGHITGELELPAYSYPNLLLRNCIICCAFYRREDFDRVNGYEHDMFILEDWDFWLSLLGPTSKVHRIDEFLYHYRKHESGSLVNGFTGNASQHREHLDIIFKKHIDKYLEHFGNPIAMYRKFNELQAFRDKVVGTPLFKLYAWLKKK